MKRLFLFFLIMTTIPAFSQNAANVLSAPIVSQANVEFNGSIYPGYLIEFNASDDLVEAAIKDQLNSQGVKPKSIKGFMVYRNVRVATIDPVNAVDAFIKVDKKSKKEKDQTLVSLIAAKPGEIPDSKIKSDVLNATPVLAGVGAGFLTGLNPNVEMKKFEKAVVDKGEEIAKAEKKMRNLQDDQSDLEKKIRQYQKELENNKKAQEQQTAELSNLKNLLLEIQSKRPGS